MGFITQGAILWSFRPIAGYEACEIFENELENPWLSTE
jgi:hypothetical protein